MEYVLLMFYKTARRFIWGKHENYSWPGWYMHRVFGGAATSLLIKNQNTWFLWSTFLNSWSTWSQPCLLPLVLVAGFQRGDEQQKPLPWDHWMGFSTSSPLAAVGTFLSGMLFSSWTGSGTGIFPSVLTLKVSPWALTKAAPLSMSAALFPVLCSSVLCTCAWEEATARWPQWGSSPEVLKSPAHQAHCCLLQEETCLHPSSSVILWAAHGFSPKYRIFSVLLSPIPPTRTEPKTNWGTGFGLCALKSSELLPLQNIASDLGRAWSGIPRAELCVCLCLPGADQQQWLCFVCVWLRGWGCVCLCV